MPAERYRFVEKRGEPHPVYVVNTKTGQRYHLVPMADAAPEPRAVPARFAPGSDQRQTCKACGLPSEVCFHVPDDVWASIVPEHLRNFVVYLTCFDIMAKSSGISYANKICREVYFVGERGSFTFHVAHAVEC